MSLYSEYSTEALFNGQNGLDFKRYNSIIKKKRILRSIMIFSRRVKRLSTLDNPETKREINRKKMLSKNIKKTIFQAWKKKTSHIIFDGINVKEYSVEKIRKKCKKKSNNKKNIIYPYYVIRELISI